MTIFLTVIFGFIGLYAAIRLFGSVGILLAYRGHHPEKIARGIGTSIRTGPERVGDLKRVNLWNALQAAGLIVVSVAAVTRKLGFGVAALAAVGLFGLGLVGYVVTQNRANRRRDIGDYDPIPFESSEERKQQERELAIELAEQESSEPKKAAKRRKRLRKLGFDLPPVGWIDLDCEACSRPFRVPTGKGRIRARCPRCDHQQEITT